MSEVPSPESGAPVPVQPVLEYASPAANVKPKPAMPGVLRLAGRVWSGMKAWSQWR